LPASNRSYVSTWRSSAQRGELTYERREPLGIAAGVDADRRVGGHHCLDTGGAADGERPHRQHANRGRRRDCRNVL
jgi:hypothetical protein